jgi:hypothetical protein
MVRSASWSHNDSSKQVHSILIRPHKYSVYSNWRKRQKIVTKGPCDHGSIFKVQIQRVRISKCQ